MRTVAITVDSIAPDILSDFHHSQLITRKWVRRNDQWEITDTSVLREWNDEKRAWITQYLLQQIVRGGTVVAAFELDQLVGFCSIDGYLLGKTAKYANLTMLFVDDKLKRNGIGRKLFAEICSYAKHMEADKLFISAIPAVETLAFYFSIGCKDAVEIIPEYVDTEHDRYLEFEL